MTTRAQLQAAVDYMTKPASSNTPPTLTELKAVRTLIAFAESALAAPTLCGGTVLVVQLDEGK